MRGLTSANSFLNTLPVVTSSLFGNTLCKLTIDPTLECFDYSSAYNASELEKSTGEKLILKYIGSYGKSKIKRKDAHGDEKIARLLLPLYGINITKKLSKDSDRIDDVETGVEFKCVSELSTKQNFADLWHVKMNFSSQAREALERSITFCVNMSQNDCSWRPVPYDERISVAKFSGKQSFENLKNLPDTYKNIVKTYMSFDLWFSGKIVALYLIREHTFLFIPKSYLSANSTFLGNNGRGDMKFDVLFTSNVNELQLHT